MLKWDTSSHASGKKGGVTIIPNSISFEIITETKDKDSQDVQDNSKLEHKEVTLLNIYGCQELIKPFLKKIFDLIASETYGISILVFALY